MFTTQDAATSGAQLMEGTDVCFAPVLTMGEAAEHPHNVARGDVRRGRRRHAAGAGAALQPHDRGDRPGRRRTPGQHTREVLADWGIPNDRIDELVESGAVVARLSHERPRRHHFAYAFAGFVVVVAACGDDDDGDAVRTAR